MVEYTVSESNKRLQQILDLQRKNLKNVISASESQKEGFLTVEHDMEILSQMNDPYPHIIAIDHDQVVGYTLCMEKIWRTRIPLLEEMFQQIDHLTYKDQVLGAVNYLVMGQVCIAKSHRGQGLFSGLYNHLRMVMQPHFKYIITEISIHNKRSIRAHEKVGFEEIHRFSDDVDDWSVVIWDWNF
ncbi:MAG: GNAT family N-acetyltransferase [Bacteroidota bacterium]